jgi:hypothetical protein
MKVFETEVTFFDENDLVSFAQNLPIEEIELKHLRHRELIMKSEVLILKINGNYKIIKSRY